MHEPIVENAILPKKYVRKIYVKKIQEIRDFPGILEKSYPPKFSRIRDAYLFQLFQRS
jgi:hypothetical protein